MPLCVQEKRSAYAPTLETPVRYDGIYRIVRCWRTTGAQVRGGRMQPVLGERQGGQGWYCGRSSAHGRVSWLAAGHCCS